MTQGILRDTIIQALKEGLEKEKTVFALWLEGADASGSVDEFSDIDFWVDVKDSFEEKAFEKIEGILSKIAPIDFSLEKKHDHPKVRQKFFHLKGTSEFLIIDICLESHSRKFWYIEGFEEVRILFDKAKVIKFRKVDWKKINKENKKRALELEKTHLFFQAWVKKECARRSFLEALHYYQTYALNPLIEILRIRFRPEKKGFHTKRISKDLPADVFETIEEFYKVSSTEEILEKTRKANDLFFKTLEEIKKAK